MIEFTSHDIITKTWSGFKTFCSARNGIMQWDDSDGQDDLYTIFFYDGPVVFVCRLYKVGRTPDALGFDSAQNDSDVADFEDNYKDVINKPIRPTTADGKEVYASWPTEGSRVTAVTHNWSDKTTWYQKSTRVVQETATPVVSGTSYSTSHSNLIDTYHGKLWDEDTLKDSSNHSYRVVVEVNSGSGWVQKTEVDPHTLSGDYTINYSTGVVTFSPAIDESSSVRMTYHYAGSSEFVIKPDTGKLLKIRTVEVQFSQDVELLDTVNFAAYGYVDVFAPQYLQSNGGPYPSLTKIPIANTRYKTMYDFQAESNGALPVIPAIGGDGWRAIHNPIVVFPWNYAALLTLSGRAGMEVRISLQHDVPFGGEFATATLYCLSEDE